MEVTSDFVKLQPTPQGTFKILEDFYPFVDKSIKIPANYVTNGANIPRPFWVVIPPFYPKYLNAVVVHDYFCDLEDYANADAYFKLLLLHVEDNYKTRSMIFSVRAYHKIKY